MCVSRNTRNAVLIELKAVRKYVNVTPNWTFRQTMLKIKMQNVKSMFHVQIILGKKLETERSATSERNKFIRQI